MSKSNYQQALDKHGESPKALQWNNYQSIAKRYRELVADIEIESRSIIDIGCGMGDLLPFLHSKSSNFNYVGIDITPEFIDIAKKRYHGHEFRVHDPFNNPLKQKFDIVVSSGVLSANIPNWQEHRKIMINQMFDLCNEALAFNMAGGFAAAPNSPRIAYAKTRDILDFCQTLTPKIILRTHYSKRDFTISMFK